MVVVVWSENQKSGEQVVRLETMRVMTFLSIHYLDDRKPTDDQPAVRKPCPKTMYNRNWLHYTYFKYLSIKAYPIRALSDCCSLASQERWPGGDNTHYNNE